MVHPSIHRPRRRVVIVAAGLATIVCSLPAEGATPRRLTAPGIEASREKEKAENEPIPVHIAGIRMVGPEQALLLLADEKELRAVPIAVGRDQGIAIYLGKEKTPTPRPMTHDLMVKILKTLKVKVERVTITELRESTYYAEIRLRSGRKKHSVDSRPSDAIALAVRIDVPIFASPDLLRSLDEEEEPSLLAEEGRALGLSVQPLETTWRNISAPPESRASWWRVSCRTAPQDRRGCAGGTFSGRSTAAPRAT